METAIIVLLILILAAILFVGVMVEYKLDVLIEHFGIKESEVPAPSLIRLLLDKKRTIK